MKFFKFLKDFLLYVPLTFIINPFYKLYFFLSHFNMLIVWINKHKNKFEYNDFYRWTRNYEDRLKLFQYTIDKYIKEEPIIYLELGVSKAVSFRWWLDHITNPQSQFFGFDTFEGLPENWGQYQAGAMSAAMPDINDPRAHFFKGIFQETLVPFIDDNRDLLHSNVRKVIHMDADLYSSTIFSLSQLYPYLNNGDLIFFDEFNVATHEFKAFKEFTESFYIELKPIGAVNNFYQTVFMVAK